MLVDRLERSHDLARQHLKQAAKRMKSWYDRRVKKEAFTVGEQVRILNLRLYPKLTSKWYQKLSDRGTITRKINDVTYEVKCLKWKPPLRIVHIDKLLRITEFRLIGSDGKQLQPLHEDPEKESDTEHDTITLQLDA